MNNNLESKKIISVIEPDNLPFLSEIEVFETISSTNTYLLEKAKAGAPSGSVCFAQQQTHGRGRRGRTWHTTPGSSINCSLLWRFTDTENISGLSIAIAIMVIHVLKKYGIAGGVQLKWPNDILFDGRKLAGILLEKSDSAIVIGIGLNLYLPKEAESTWISIHDITTREVDGNYLAGLLVNELLAKLPVYQALGLSAFSKEWRAYDVLFGKSVTVHTPEQSVTGIMQGINERGELLLQESQERCLSFCYGEVSVRFE